MGLQYKHFYYVVQMHILTFSPLKFSIGNFEEQDLYRTIFFFSFHIINKISILHIIFAFN